MRVEMVLIVGTFLSRGYAEFCRNKKCLEEAAVTNAVLKY